MAAGAEGGGTTGPMSPSGASSRSTITGAWSLGPVPLRAWRSTHAARTRPADRRAGQHQVDPHPEVLVEHPGPVVPVGEHPLGRPAIAHDVVQAERLQLGQRRPLGRRDVGLARRRRPDRTRRRRSARCSCRRRRSSASGPAATIVAQRGQPGELVLVVLGARRPPVRHVHRDDADPAAGRGDRARLRVREAGRAGESRSPRRRAPPGTGSPPRSTAPGRERRPRSPGRRARRRAARVNASSASLVSCRPDDVGLPLVQPGQQPRHPLLDRVHVPGRYPHPAYSSPLRLTACGRRRPTWLTASTALPRVCCSRCRCMTGAQVNPPMSTASSCASCTAGSR